MSLIPGEVKRAEFYEDYVDALAGGFAAVFAGAGLSMPSGYVDWRALLREVAADISLDVDREQDLVAVAQYYVNEREDHARLFRLLRENFDERLGVPSDVHETLARLPIRTLWTTNYDSLFEQAFGSARLEVKSSETQFAIPATREVLLYKMHGSTFDYDDVVLTRDHYENYARTHPGFLASLRADLINKTFVFLGVGLTDPNLWHVLSELRVGRPLLPRRHYIVQKRHGDYDGVRQAKLVQDLARYGLFTVFIENYSDLPVLLLELERHLLRRSVMISGASVRDEATQGDGSRSLSVNLGAWLVGQGLDIVCGFGMGVGEDIIAGVGESTLSALRDRMQNSAFGRWRGQVGRLKLRPIPFGDSYGNDLRDAYRREIVRESGIVVFIGGETEAADGRIQESKGVMREFELCQEERRVPVPVGYSGGAALAIWRQVKENYLQTYSAVNVSVPPEDIFDRMGPDAEDPESVFGAVCEFTRFFLVPRV